MRKDGRAVSDRAGGQQRAAQPPRDVRRLPARRHGAPRIRAGRCARARRAIGCWSITRPMRSWCSTRTRAVRRRERERRAPVRPAIASSCCCVGPGGAEPARAARRRSCRASRSSAHVQRALDEGPQMFEWLHRDAFGKEFMCEVRLVRLPSGTRRLVRGSITDISRAQARTRACRAPSAKCSRSSRATRRCRSVLESITRLIESVRRGHDVLR